MKYTLEDVLSLELPPKKLKSFFLELCELLHMQGLTIDPDHDTIRAMVKSGFKLESYKESVEYLLADNNVQKAHVAMRAKTTHRNEKKIIELWAKYADSMNGFERLMQGWNK